MPTAAASAARDTDGKEDAADDLLTPAALNHRKVYVLDTSVLIADPSAIFRFDEHAVCVPAVVVKELESHKSRPDTGHFARQAIRTLEEFRVEHGTLRHPMPINTTGRLWVELNHRAEVLPTALRDGSNDARILTVAKNLQRDGHDVVLVTKDLALRLNADIAGLDAEAYRHEQADVDGYTGLIHVDAQPDLIDALYDEGQLDYPDLPENDQLAVNCSVVLRAGKQSALARLHADKTLRRIDPTRLLTIEGRTAEQRALIDLLADNSVKIVSAGGPAGGGKTIIAVAAGLAAVQDPQSPIRRVVMYRPTIEVGGKGIGGIGFLPGTVDEKLAPYRQALDDVLEELGFTDEHARRRLYDRDLALEHLGFVRGRTLRNTWVILDEAQQLERVQLLTLLSRIGQGSKIVMCFDQAQRDNTYVGRHDGVASVVAKLKGHPIFGHVTLTKVERSEVAELVTVLLDDGR